MDFTLNLCALEDFWLWSLEWLSIFVKTGPPRRKSAPLQGRDAGEAVIKIPAETLLVNHGQHILALMLALCSTMVYYALCNAQCTMHWVLCSIYFTLCTIHSVLCTVHFALCTMHGVLCIGFEDSASEAWSTPVRFSSLTASTWHLVEQHTDGKRYQKKQDYLGRNVALIFNHSS